MDEAILLNDIGAARLVGISRSSWWRGVSVGTFPKPVRIGGLTRWRRDEIEAVIARLTAERDAEVA